MTNPALLVDCYKLDHRRQYPDNTTRVVSNFTARSTRRADAVTHTVFFGLQYFCLEYLIERWNRDFFQRPLREVADDFTAEVQEFLGPNDVGQQHIEALHTLQYLPLRIMALPEGSLVPLRVPSLAIESTHPEFGWMTNYVETILSTTLWGPCTSATTAFEYRKLLTRYALRTVGNAEFVPWQAHDFSFRGMFGLEAAQMSGAAHLTCFTGTDTVPAVPFLKKYYQARGLIGGSVAATEHSVMCAGGMEDEQETIRRLIQDVYPAGIVSVVSDTWDFWKVLTETAVSLQDTIMKRDGKVVFRPDTGIPELIICGDPNATEGSPEYKGAIEVLWDIFGGTLSPQGYKVLDSHVGLIYGDSITLERAEKICAGLEAKGFASTNVVLGVGSFTYQYVTRDTDGYAVKATYAEVNGEARALYKAPKTGDGTKNSARGLVSVVRNAEGDYELKENVTEAEFYTSELQEVFRNSQMIAVTTLDAIRARIDNNLYRFL